MTSEIQGDLTSIHDEDLLRRMWQQSEDFGLKKEIRTHMYKLREERLRNFYTTGIMDTTGFESTKTPLTPIHGDSLADQSFQSFKTKEIRDSESPCRDFAVSRSGFTVPDTSGWNIVTSSEVSPDGRARKTESIATTEGVQKLPGGRSEFAGKNEHVTKVAHQGDDRNFVKTADESSASRFHEQSVVGDKNSGKVETKSSTTTSSSHMKTSRFSSTNNNDPLVDADHEHIVREFDNLMDTARKSTERERQQRIQEQYTQQRRLAEHQHQQRIQNERHSIDNSTNAQTLTNQRNDNLISQHESKNIEKEVDLLAAQPGVIISRTVDYPDPNTKVITETKRLPDGTTVTSRKFETKSASSKSFKSSSNQQHSTTSRTVVEDRAQRSHVEYLKDDEIDQIRKQQKQQYTIPKETESIQRNNRSESVASETTMRRSTVKNVDNTDMTSHRETAKNQVEDFHIDNTAHHTVKKDLNQQYRIQDFIDGEREYQSQPRYHESPQHHISSATTRTERLTTNREVKTDKTTKDFKEPMPAAGKPSYNVQKPSTQQSPTRTPERTSPAKDRYPVSSTETPKHYSHEHQIPIDVSKPDKVSGAPYQTEPVSTQSAGKPSYQPAAGKPSYPKPVDHKQTTENTQKSNEYREIRVEHTTTKSNLDDEFRSPIQHQRTGDTPIRSMDYPYEPRQEASTPRSQSSYPYRYPNEERNVPVNTASNSRDITVTSSVTKTYSQQPEYQEAGHPKIKTSNNNQYYSPQLPNDSKSGYTPSQPNYESPQTDKNYFRKTQPVPNPKYGSEQLPHDQQKPEVTRPNERQIPIARADKPEYPQHQYPAGKPSYVSKQQADTHSSSPREPPKRPTQREIPIDSERRENKYEHPAGKPSYVVGSRPEDDRRQPQYDITNKLQYVRRPSEESHVSTDTIRTNQTYTTNRISVEVDAAHDAFARSLRCASPSDRNSVKSFRNSSASIRSSTSPGKYSPRGRKPQRSPSRESLTYSESSKISNSTVTKERSDSQKETIRSRKTDENAPKRKPSNERLSPAKIQPMGTKEPKRQTEASKSPNKPSVVSKPKDERSTISPIRHATQPRDSRSSERIDSTTSTTDSVRHVTTATKQTVDYSGEKKAPPKSTCKVQTKPSQHQSSKTTRSPDRKTKPNSNITQKTKNIPVHSPHIEAKPQNKSPTIGMNRTATKTEKQPTSPINALTSRNTRFTQSVIDKQSKESKRSPQKISKEPYPDVSKVSRPRHSSPERFSRPHKTDRESPRNESGYPPKEVPAHCQPAVGIPSNYPASSKFRKTVEKENISVGENKPYPHGPKAHDATHTKKSDDEGFEPESPRSSSPTSSVSDLVYHKGLEKPDHTKQQQRKITHHNTNMDEFITRETEYVENTRDRNTTSVCDENRKHKKSSPSPERKQPTQTDNLPQVCNDEEIDSDIPYTSQLGGVTDSPKTEHISKDSPQHMSKSPEYKQPYSDTYDYSSDGDDHKVIPETEKVRKPFYLIEPDPQAEDGPEEPKSKPILKRSETYEERCRKILGMVRSEVNEVSETNSQSQPKDRETTDFITAEQIIEEDNRRPEKLKSSPTSTNPRKSTPKEKEPVDRGYSPTRSPERLSHQYSKKVDSSIKETQDTSSKRKNQPRSSEMSPERKQPSQFPQNDKTRSSENPKDQQCKSPRTSPTRKSKPELKNVHRETSPSPIRNKKLPHNQSPNRTNNMGTRSDHSRTQRTPQNTSNPYRRRLSPDRKRESPEVDNVETSTTEIIITTSRRPLASPETSPTRKVSVNRSPERQSIKKITTDGRSKQRASPKLTQHPLESKEYTDAAQNKTKLSGYSPVRSPVCSPARSPAISPTRSPVRSPVRSTISSPVRSPVLSPARSPVRSPIRSPVRSPSPSTKYAQNVTVVSQHTVKNRSPSPQTRTNANEPRPRPNHITTAKIQISPAIGTKLSRSEIKKSTKTPQRKTNETPKHPVKNTSPTRNAKSTVPRNNPVQPNAEKLRPTSNIKSTKTDKTVYTEEYESEESSTEAPSDTEEVTTVIETITTRRLPSKDQSTRKYTIADRKESAPVYKSTTVEKDKMLRSTSESIIKTKTFPDKPQSNSPVETDSPRRKSIDKKRPVKCMATKTINLTATDNIINSKDMENVIIDIQQAKSSREPSPNRLVPLPVRNDEGTGIPRYPDTVQEPEEETRRRPKVKDIPIFEEDTNEYVRCHISEVREHDEKKKKTTVYHDEEETDETVRHMRKESSPRRISPHKHVPLETDDDYRLSVHDKVAKFISTAEKVKQPKPSAPFQRESRPDDTEHDDCLLSVNDKVNIFLTTADSITKPVKSSDASNRPQRIDIGEIDGELKNDECILTVSEKVNKFTTSSDMLIDDAPQRAPQLVAKIERQISRKDDTPSDTEEEEPEKTKETSVITVITTRTNQFERPKVADKPRSSKAVVPKSAEVVKKAKAVFEKDVTSPKQRDILGRPSVWDGNRPDTEVRLEDIGVHKPFDDETEEILKRERSRSRSPGDAENVPRKYQETTTRTTSNILTDSVSSKKRLFEDRIASKSTTTKTTIKQNMQDSIKPYSSKDSNQPKEKTRPGKISSREFPPTKCNKKEAGVPDFDDEGYIEEVTHKMTTSKHIQRESPFRRLDYSSPERDSISPRPPVEVSSPRNAKPKVPDASPSRKEYSNESPTKTSMNHQDDIPKRIPASNKPLTSGSHANSKLTQKHREPSSIKPSVTQKPIKSHPVGQRPSYMEPTVCSLEHRRDSLETARATLRPDTDSEDNLDLPHSVHPGGDSPAPTSSIPSYMEHTISSIEHRRDSLEVTKSHSRRTSHESLQIIESQPKSAKFGVELKRTDQHDSKPRRKSSSNDVPPIEEIFDLELLEKMLETVVGYEMRRRIRAQIRIVKRMIEEGSLQKNVTTTTTTTSVTRRGSDLSPGRKTETSPSRLVNLKKKTHTSTPESRSTTNQFIEKESRHIAHHETKSTIRERSPQGVVRTVTTTTVKKSGEKGPTKKPVTPRDEKPVWAIKNILKKPSEHERTTVKPTTPSKTERQFIQKDDADCIISSYGIGPTDDDGKPLFGIRALKKKPQQSGETRKVTGSVVTESYYSENGKTPVGERKVLVYSNDPDDITDYEQTLDQTSKGDIVARERLSKDGITSITRVQKIGKTKGAELKDLPALTDGGKRSVKQSKVVRRGSVKEMSEKFTRKGSTTSTTSTTEKSTIGSYPKAGLILRTQNYSSTENDDPFDECNLEIRTTRKSSRTQLVAESDSEAEQRLVTKTTKTFLNSNGEKVTGVADVLDRMRNADNVGEEGDTAEDREARSLLNKFLGASVLMSGVETMVPKEVITRTVVDTPSKREVKTTRVTKTITTGGSSSPVARKTCDIEEIWDEEYLKQLLEQSTNYEERRRIRARIRQIMAEKEACTDITTETEQQGAAETKIEKEATRAAANNESDTESEYEVVEVVEEVTDDSSAEVEDNEEDEGEEDGEEEGEEDEDENNKTSETDQESSCSDAENVKNKITIEPKKIETVKANDIENVAKVEKEEKTGNTVEKESNGNDKQSEKELEAKEQKSCTTQTTEMMEKDGAVVTTTTKVTTCTVAAAPKPMSPFAKFRQLDKQNSQNSPVTPSSPMTPGGSNRGAPLFQFTDPALSARAATVKDQLLQWCQMKTKEYENVQITNFSTSWTDGLAFCALIHHFLPDAFDYSKLTPKERRHNFELAFRVADEKAGIAPLLDVEDMVTMRKPDWKCVFTYVQTIFRRFRNSV